MMPARAMDRNEMAICCASSSPNQLLRTASRENHVGNHGSLAFKGRDRPSIIRGGISRELRCETMVSEVARIGLQKGRATLF